MTAVAPESNADDISEEEARAILEAMEQDDDPLATTLRTDRRVLARVTDGIYRQPGSALRELISNAYDADATEVVLRTDRPRFDRIEIEDNGHGMSAATLLRLLYHIGGSSKRTSMGKDFGVTSADDPLRSPGGRYLIGKIGIGIFSVAQLTQSFQIITKVAGEDHRTVASVTLKTYNEAPDGTNEDEEYEAGKVLVWRERARDLAAHGTTVVLTAVHPQTKETLRSLNLWSRIFTTATSNEVSQVQPPRFNIGFAEDSGKLYRRSSKGGDPYSLPWAKDDSPSAAFAKLVRAVWDAQWEGQPNPQLSFLLDYYLQMVWDLSLQLPLPYIRISPFDVPQDEIDVFSLDTGNSLRRGAAVGEPKIAASLLKHLPAPPSVENFRVQIDDLELSRPIDVTDRPPTSNVLDRPILFVGSYVEPFADVDLEVSGGPLALTAYIVWSPKIVPVEHRGVIIRVHESSGAVFENSFLRYASTERRREQITCEIFIQQGFDSALNIDRESFNFAHPHAVATTRWLHAALDYVIRTQKRLGTEARREKRAHNKDILQERVAEILERAWAQRTEDEESSPPSVEFVTDVEGSSREAAGYRIRRAAVPSLLARTGDKARRFEAQLTSIGQLLAVYDFLDGLDSDERADLLSYVAEILSAFES